MWDDSNDSFIELDEVIDGLFCSRFEVSQAEDFLRGVDGCLHELKHHRCEVLKALFDNYFPCGFGKRRVGDEDITACIPAALCNELVAGLSPRFSEADDLFSWFCLQ